MYCPHCAGVLEFGWEERRVCLECGQALPDDLHEQGALM